MYPMSLFESGESNGAVSLETLFRPLMDENLRKMAKLSLG
jgi:hypothetical protein